MARSSQKTAMSIYIHTYMETNKGRKYRFDCGKEEKRDGGRCIISFRMVLLGIPDDWKEQNYPAWSPGWLLENIVNSAPRQTPSTIWNL